ncbi:hypothetical protein [Peribacillus sp. Hz7]|uniref:hypothetical protein n=1 Tax=Peribacillus sp. Hz7 TaxID=3344873 RepID=UPI0035CA3C38
MKKKFLGLLTVMAIVFTLVLAGCAPSKSVQSIEKEVKREIDELVLSIKGEPDTGFDPTTGWGRYGSPLFQSMPMEKIMQKIQLVQVRINSFNGIRDSNLS